QLVPARLHRAEVETLYRGDAGVEENPVRLLIADRQVVDPDQANPAGDEPARSVSVEPDEVACEVARPQSRPFRVFRSPRSAPAGSAQRSSAAPSIGPSSSRPSATKAGPRSGSSGNCSAAAPSSKK